MDLLNEAKEKAEKVLKHCEKPIGFFASGLPGGYEALWARDSMITSLGAALIGEQFKTTFRKSLECLSKYQSPHGQIPNAVGDYNLDRRSKITYNTVDSTLWYIIGHFAYAAAYKDNNLLKQYQKNIEDAFRWLEYQDPDEVGLIAQQPTTDWQDAFPHKYGYTISTHALYYQALKMRGENKKAAYLKKIINGEIKKYLSLYDQNLGYYLPWAWKNHSGNREQEKWFDSFGNILAILTGLADRKQAESIISYIKEKKINKPYPCKAIFPPLKKGDKEWHSYFSKCSARRPYYYLNAGIWPFLGGFYVAALVKAKKFKEAAAELKNLALANKEGKRNKNWGFHEWLYGLSGKPLSGSNPFQGWSAGTYLLAYESVKNKKVPFF